MYCIWPESHEPLFYDCYICLNSSHKPCFLLLPGKHKNRKIWQWTSKFQSMKWMILTMITWCTTYRDRKTVEMDFPATANCFGHIFLQRMLYYTEEAQENMLKLGSTSFYFNIKTKNWFKTWKNKNRNIFFQVFATGHFFWYCMILRNLYLWFFYRAL